MADDLVHDPDLLDALDQIPMRPYKGVVWRVTWATRDALAGGTSGGRWHPPGDVEVLYTSVAEEGALAEIYYHLSRAPVFSSSHTKIAKIEIEANTVLDLRDMALLHDLGVSREDFQRGVYHRTAEIGSAARFLDADALLVPSARAETQNFVVFLDRIENPDNLRIIELHDINWPAYRESLKK